MNSNSVACPELRRPCHVPAHLSRGPLERKMSRIRSSICFSETSLSTCIFYFRSRESFLIAPSSSFSSSCLHNLHMCLLTGSLPLKSAQDLRLIFLNIYIFKLSSSLLLCHDFPQPGHHHLSTVFLQQLPTSSLGPQVYPLQATKI